MITLDQFRARLRPPAKKPFIDWSKWIGSPTAWLALTLSALSTYQTMIRKADDLRVVVSTTPLMRIKTGEDGAARLHLSKPTQNLVLINSGNRAAAISSIALHLWFQSNGRPTCDGTHVPKVSLFLFYDFVPQVIKPGEMTSLSVEKVKRIEATPRIAKADESGDELMWDISAGSKPTDGDIMVSCLSFLVILPDSGSKHVDLLLGYAENQMLSTPGELAFYDRTFTRSHFSPAILVKQ
jgi:hypothetical protein